MPDQDRKATPRDVLRMVFRRRRLFVLGAAVFAIAALIGAQYWPLKYTGMTYFERRTDPASLEAARNRTESFESIKLTLQHELVGRTAIERAVEELGLTKGVPRGRDGELTLQGKMAKQVLVQRLMANVQIRWDVRSQDVDLVSVSFTHDDPNLAQDMPNTLVRNYITQVSEQIVERLKAGRDFLLKQVNECDGRLDEATKQRIEFEARYGGMLPESPSALLDSQREVASDMDTVRRQHLVATQKLERLKALAEKTPDSAEEPVQVIRGPNPELERLKEELRKYQDQLDSAINLRHMTDNHPTVQTLHKKIEELTEQVVQTPEETVLQKVFGSDATDEGLSMALAGAQSEVEMGSSELERLQGRLTTVQNLVANYAPIREQYLKLLKKVTEVEVEKTNWQGRLTGVDMALSAEVAKRRTHLNAVQLAEKQFRPSSPQLLYVLGLALAGGLAFGGGLVFLGNTLDRSIATTEDAAKHFDLPVFGVVGEIVTPRERVWRTTRWLVVEPMVALFLLGVIGLTSINIVLWINYPEQYAVWRANPSGFVQQRLAEGARTLRQSL
ncbi:MAG TPA: hypothetical protein VNA25_19335 [Phycisphaerae bacterium]|nr:hypothetical protein [Phycisphaerae bacterium]